MNALLVAGTASDAGKSVITAGICRWLVRQGLKVAPFTGALLRLIEGGAPAGLPFIPPGAP